MSTVVESPKIGDTEVDAPSPEFYTGPTTDFFSYQDFLTVDEQNLVATARAVFEREIRPVVAEHWNNETFPFEIIPALSNLNLVDLCARGDNFLLHGFMTVELARVDASISTFVGVHSGLFAAAIAQLGTDDQRDRFLADAISLRKIGAFALTEPDHGSDVSRNMETTATRTGDSWTLNGVKRWIGSGTFAANVLVWARDTADDQIKGFIVDATLAGFTAEKIENKIALRIVQNATITLRNVVVAERDRLPGATSFRDTNRLLTNSRVWVGWQSVGLQFAAYDYALRYALERRQFGKPIASFQLVQEKLVRILENATTSLGLMVRIAQLQQAGTLRPEHAAMAKASASARMRESVALGRSVFGGNGISTSWGIARVFADAEALYTYEGSYEVNTLVVGRAITGISAFE
ncbi:acyl-CoA dehydrogenase family protein [Cryobacterium sp. TMS1-13-1]|uniref:acyl-CoA dehydrogenase family protein n=1 Tax=Cryobacterium sp. TMS1-13-1 TaxID=1259220 RepID=UPI00106AC838|nr:acyl-CoA dehydrogenase family protein [Cryobacterium sp. TMS1-13-1]TFD19540.1 acyl-CoA dehydrogenase [Cryobacterium sp. TMS1-13-1]